MPAKDTGHVWQTWLLNFVYVAAILVCLPWLFYQAIFHGKYRKGWPQKLMGIVPRRDSEKPCVWLHGVSVGEINLLQGVLREIERRHPDLDCVISTTTQAAYDLACKKYESHLVFYCPLDFSWAIRNVLKRLQPNILVLGELELWPNLIRICADQQIRVAVVNARLSENSFRGYRRIKFLIDPILKKIHLIAAQNNTYAQRFMELGSNAHATHVTGSVKFDGAATDRKNAKTQALSILAGIEESDVVFLTGSTQAPEEQISLNCYLQLRGIFPNLRLIVVPRHPERFESVAQTLSASKILFSRRSQLSGSDRSERVLLVDTVGELSAWWGVSSIAYVGGSMGKRGGQNMIEPAAYGAAVCFGPHTKNFKDVVEQMLKLDAARIVRTESELVAFVTRCLTESSFAEQMGRNAKKLVQDNSGALKRTMRLLSPIIAESVSRIVEHYPFPPQKAMDAKKSLPPKTRAS